MEITEMPTYCDTNELPYSVLRWVRNYRPKLRSAIVRQLREIHESGRAITTDDISNCVGLSLDLLEAEMESCVALPPPDAATVEVALQEAREGKGRNIDQILAELP
jgi:hypothetical protein